MTTIGLLPERCRGCVSWELDAQAVRSAVRMGDTEFEKEVWLSGVMLTWGSAGQIVTVDDVPVGFALFAPPTAVPGAGAFPTSPVSPDAVLLTTARIHPDFTGQGLARYLMNGVVRALTRRGVRAIELFGREEPVNPGNDNLGTDNLVADNLGADTSGHDTSGVGAPGDGPHGDHPAAEVGWIQEAGIDVRWAEFDAQGWTARGAVQARAGAPAGSAPAADNAVDDDVPPCLLPAAFARAVGFVDVAAHHRYPRLRLELGRDIGWKAQVEAALEELFASVSIPASPPPAVRELAGVGANRAAGPTGLRPSRGCAARGRADRRT